MYKRQAHHITGQQPLRPAAQIAVQSVHLAGRTGKEHRTALQHLAHLSVGGADVALDILYPPQPLQLLPSKAGHMVHLEIGAHGGAEHHTAVL